MLIELRKKRFKGNEFEELTTFIEEEVQYTCKDAMLYGGTTEWEESKIWRADKA